MIQLEPMSSSEARSFIQMSADGYATDLAAVARSDLGEARDQAQKQLAEILPEGENSPGHQFLWIVHDGERIGQTWISSNPAGAADLFIWDIAVDAEHQSKGLGGGALDAIVQIARRKGMNGVELSVFENNQAARRLYEHRGFVAGPVSGGQVPMRLSIG
jgi:GNAT superfamily N-acetyltransferase